jgi:N utilization substance protein A
MPGQSAPPADFARALLDLKGKYELPPELILHAVEEALATAYRKEFDPHFPVTVKIDPETGRQKVYAVKTVVPRVRDEAREIGLPFARRKFPEAQENDEVEIELAQPESWGRIAALTFKQTVQQRIRDAEHAHTFTRFADQEGELVTGVVTRVDASNGMVYVGLGGTEAILPAGEQMPGEKYAQRQHIQAYLMDVQRSGHSTQLTLSRTHKGLLRRLLELEVPEVLSGTVEIKSIAREAGSRSKVAVLARQEGLDPIGACVGLHSTRINNIVAELHGEKVDIITWFAEPGAFVASALRPAVAVSTEVLEAEHKVVVTVPVHQLSLAIGKEGQNARLAARLTGWRIDIKAGEVAVAAPDPNADGKE